MPKAARGLSQLFSASTPCFTADASDHSATLLVAAMQRATKLLQHYR